MILDNVRYIRSDQVKDILDYERCFFLKRPHFKFEEEVRLSLDTYFPPSPTKNTPSGYELPVALKKLIEGVLVHPDSSFWFRETVESLTKKYGFGVEVRPGSHGNT